MESSDAARILFVCLGNICRSPLAEGVFLHLARQSGSDMAYHVDSAGTGSWHVGEAPDPRSLEVARRHGVELRGPARQVRREDFLEFDWIVAMDQQNLRDLERTRPAGGARASLTLLRAFDPDADGDLSVPDPYYGGPDGFEHVFAMVQRSCRALLERLESERKG